MRGSYREGVAWGEVRKAWQDPGSLSLPPGNSQRRPCWGTGWTATTGIRFPTLM